MRPHWHDRVVNTRGSLIGYIKPGLHYLGPGPLFVVVVGRHNYRILEWDRSWMAWVAFGRAKPLEVRITGVHE